MGINTNQSTDSENKISASEQLAWTLLLLFPSMLLGGWIFKTMWGWFVTPFGVPTIEIWHSMGIVMTVRMLTTGQSVNNNTHPLTSAIIGALVGLFVLGVAALVHLGM